MTITIDPYAGFCTGVTRAVKIAEQELAREKPLFCLGEIVHNEPEVARLRDLGLVTIDHEQFRRMRDCRVLIRAHGEPPETYRVAKENNISLMDASCPVVLRLQRDIRQSYSEMREKNGQVVIYGKEDHPEVLGLKGQSGDQAIVIRSLAEKGKIDLSRPFRLFSQTTMDISGLHDLASGLQMEFHESGADQKMDFVWKDSICRQVSGRSEKIKEFAARFEAVVFVSGKKSSNGLSLFQICRQVNPRSFFVTGKEELRREWFEHVNHTGITGATSTPAWQMKEISEEILKISGG